MKRFICTSLIFLMVGLVVAQELMADEQGMVLYFDFANSKDQIEKGKILDLSGKENHGIIEGAKWQEEGLFFDGEGDFIEIKNSPSLSLEEFTIEVLLKPEVQPRKEGMGTDRLMVGKRGEFWDARDSFGLYLDTGMVIKGRVRFGSGKEDRYNVASFPIEAKKWCHAALAKGKERLILYVNGIPESGVANATEKPFQNSLNVYIGSINSRDFIGLIKEIKIYNYARTQSEIENSVKGTKEVKFY